MFVILFIVVAIGVLIATGLSLAALFWGIVTIATAVLRDAPWVLILIGLWMLFGPRRRRRRWREAAPAPVPAPTRSAEPAAAAVPPKKRELPIDVQVKVEQIRHKAQVLLGYADRFAPFSHELHVVRQTEAEYLPRTVEAYLGLVEEPEGAIDELKTQLGLLDSKLDEIARELQRQDMDRLIANRRFLEERFRGASDAA